MKKILLKNNFLSNIKNFFFPFYRSPELKKLFKILNKDQPTKKVVAMFVGGCVRNYILNEKIDDIDIATIFTPEEIKEKFKNTEFEVIETGVEHGSVTLITNELKFELTTLRKDTNPDGRHAEVDFIEDWTKDSERRDFTINAIYIDHNGKIFDPQMGIKDLKNNVVKFIGDPSKRIEEDFLRIIRFIRFCLQYNHTTFELSTIDAIKLNLNGIKNLSKERVLNELLKILKLDNFKHINEAKDLKNIFLMIFSELKYIDRLNKLNFYSSNLKLDINSLLAILLIDDKENHEYFCHKYKTSNLIKEKLSFFNKQYKDYKENKKYFKNDLKSNIYYIGIRGVQDLNLITFFINNKKSFKDYSLISKNIDSINIPKFPFDGKYLINKGVPEGQKIGIILKNLEEQWMQNNYVLEESQAKQIINKFNN